MKRKLSDIKDEKPLPVKKCLVDLNLVNYTGNFKAIDSAQSQITLIRSYDQKYTKNTVCFYDNYEFSGGSIGVPCKFNIENEEFTCWGNFCSLECVKAYIYDSHDSKKEYQFSLLASMARKMYGKNTRIERAPSKFLLEKYGGPLKIQEFRSELSREKMWVLRNLNIVRTQLVYDVYLNNEVFEIIQRQQSKKPKIEEKQLVLERTKGSYRIPKASINAFLGKVQIDDKI